MSHSLLIYIDEHTKFDRNEIIQAISSIEQTHNILVTKENSEEEKIFSYVLFCYYDIGEESVTIRVDTDVESIFVKSFSRAALNFALNLQQVLNGSLFATDSDYSFVCQLDKISSIKEFENVVSQGIYMNEK